MTEEKTISSKTPPKSLFWPLFLVMLGFLFLLNNFEIIPWTIWNNLYRYWPILLIFSGLEILLGKNRLSNVVMVILGLLVFGFILFISLPISWSNLLPTVELFSRIYPR